MNRNELIRATKEKCGIPLYILDEALDGFMDTIIETVSQGERVCLVGFGVFKRKEEKSRRGYDFQKKEQIYLPPRRVPEFMPGTVFMAAVSDKKEADSDSESGL